MITHQNVKQSVRSLLPHIGIELVQKVLRLEIVLPEGHLPGEAGVGL